MKATRHVISLCLVIGMTIVGNSAVLAQGANFARNTSYTSHLGKTAATKEIKELTIGDKVPDIEFQNILNYKSKKAKLSDFKAKLVILDMWSIWCTSCIAAFPKMEKLQEQFKNKLQVLLVNPHNPRFDSEKRIYETLEKNRQRTGYYPQLPMPIHDSVLNLYFPHQAVPHAVWINGEGKVIAITGSMDITAENIQKVLDGNTINIQVKNDWAFDRDKPLLIDGNAGPDNDYIFRSLITKYRPQMGSGSGVRANNKNEIIGYYMLNYRLGNLVFMAYDVVLKGLRKNNIIFDVKDPSIYKNDFDTSHIYCYDLTIAPINAKSFDINKYLRKDLENYFGISVRQERRTLPCIILKLDKSRSLPITRFKNQVADTDEQSIKKYFHNYSLNDITQVLEFYFDKPLINESGISYNVDIDFPNNFDLSNREAVLQFFKDIGFTVKTEERELEVVVITDK